MKKILLLLVLFPTLIISQNNDKMVNAIEKRMPLLKNMLQDMISASDTCPQGIALNNANKIISGEKVTYGYPIDVYIINNIKKFMEYSENVTINELKTDADHIWYVPVFIQGSCVAIIEVNEFKKEYYSYWGSGHFGKAWEKLRSIIGKDEHISVFKTNFLGGPYHLHVHIEERDKNNLTSLDIMNLESIDFKRGTLSDCKTLIPKLQNLYKSIMGVLK